ncbi:MAG: sulfur carrier protein ThiS [Anaerovoracaceae bacterium]
MKLIINKKETHLDEGTTIREILDARAYNRGAVWVNGKQLLGAEYDTYCPKDGDQIKILRIMAGG